MNESSVLVRILLAIVRTQQYDDVSNSSIHELCCPEKVQHRNVAEIVKGQGCLTSQQQPCDRYTSDIAVCLGQALITFQNS